MNNVLLFLLLFFPFLFFSFFFFLLHFLVYQNNLQRAWSELSDLRKENAEVAAAAQTEALSKEIKKNEELHQRFEIFQREAEEREMLLRREVHKLSLNIETQEEEKEEEEEEEEEEETRTRRTRRKGRRRTRRKERRRRRKRVAKRWKAMKK